MFADLRFALRSLFARPGFFAVCVITLAVGVGSVSAIFSVVNGTLLKPLPYPDAERIVRLNRTQGQWGGPVSPAVLDDWRDGAGELLNALGAFTSITVNLTGDGDAERLSAYRVTPDFWNVMGLAARHGRYFNADEDAAGERVVVLSHAFWTRRFGADPGAVGRDIMLNGESYRVVGVTPDAYRYPGGTQVYLPTSVDPAASRGSNFLFVIGRLAPGASVERLDAALATVNARLAAEFPANHAELGVRITPLPDLLTSNVRQPLLVMLVAAAMVLLIACANLANLLLARGSQRERELSVRTALGAGRLQLVRLALAEALVIAVVGGAAGVALAAAAVPALLSLAPAMMPSHTSPGVDTTAVLVSLVGTVVTVLVFASWPAWRTASAAHAAALKEEGRGASGGRAKARARSVLVTAEVALSLALLVGAGLLIESMRQLSNVDAGVDARGVLTASFVVDGVPPIPGESIADGFNRHVERVAPQVDRIVERVRAIPGVERVGVTDALPLSGDNNISSDLTIVGREAPEGQRQPGATWRFVNPDFLQSLGIRLVAGRNLADTDFRVGGVPDAVLVNETFVRRYLADVDPIGQRVTFFDMSEKTVVGVVGDTSGLGLDREPLTEVFMHSGFAPMRQFFLSVKVAGDPASYAESLRRAIADVEPAVPVFDIRTMDDVIGGPIRMRSFNMTLMSVFSGVALLLAAVGLYGVVAYSVEQRRREFGIRLSLGATGDRVASLVLGQGLRMIGVGIAVGLAGAYALTRLLTAQLYGVSAGDPAVIGATVVVLASVGVVATLLPARRAARTAPMEALRYE